MDPDDLAAALSSAEADLLLAPGVPAVRYVAAVAMHMCALGHPDGSRDRRSFLTRRDAQLDWLLARAPVDEPQRAQWQQMRSVR